MFDIKLYTYTIFTTTWHPIELIVIITLAYILIMLILALLSKKYFKTCYQITIILLSIYFILSFILLILPILQSIELTHNAESSTTTTLSQKTLWRAFIFHPLTDHISTNLFSYSTGHLAWTLIITFFSFIYFLWIFYINKTTIKLEFFIFLIIIYINLLILMTSNNLLLIEINFSLITFSTIGLILTYNPTIITNLTHETILQFFISSTFSSIFFIFSLSLVYYLTASIQIDVISLLLCTKNSVAIFIDTPLKKILYYSIFIFFSLSIAFKFNVLPFTKWILSFYETIPTTILAYITTIPKLGYTLFSINFFIKIFNTDFYLLQITFILLGSITLIYSLIGFVETNVKRILAYSSIFHGGLFYILLASQSITGVILYSILYNTTMFVIWLFIIIFENQFLINLYKKKSSFFDFHLSELNGLITKNPTLTITFLILIFILTGLPPFVFFIAKFISFIYIIQNINTLSIILLLLLCSFLTLFFYLKLAIACLTVKPKKKIILIH